MLIFISTCPLRPLLREMLHREEGAPGQASMNNTTEVLESKPSQTNPGPTLQRKPEGLRGGPAPPHHFPRPPTGATWETHEGTAIPARSQRGAPSFLCRDPAGAAAGAATSWTPQRPARCWRSSRPWARRLHPSLWRSRAGEARL